MDTALHQEGKGSERHQDGNQTNAEPKEGHETELSASSELMRHILNAATNGDVDSILHFIAAQSEDVLNRQDMEGRTALMLEARHGHTACIRLLLNDDRVLINIQDINGQTALMIAASHGHSDCVMCLLSTPDIDVKLIDEKGHTALLLASKKGHLECVRSLLHHLKVATNSSDWEKESKLAFFLAVMRGHIYCVKHFLELRTTQAVKDCNMQLGSAMALARRNSHLDSLQNIIYLINPDANLGIAADVINLEKGKESCSMYLRTSSILREILDGNQVNTDDVISLPLLEIAYDFFCQIYSDSGMVYTMLWCTAIVLYIPTECICCLCDAGESNISMFKGCMDTMIALAIANCHFDCVKRLLGNNQTPPLEITLAFIIVICKGNIECFQLLEILMANMCVNRKHSILQYGLLLSAVNGHAMFIKYLLDTGQVDVNHQDKDGDTAIMISAMKGHVDCIKRLLDTGQIDLNHQDKDRDTALTLSTLSGHVDCIKCLLETGQVDVNHQDKDGDTAILISLMNGHVDCFKCLLDTGLVDNNHCNKDGDTALTLSAEDNYFDCVKLLLDTGQVDINHCNNDGNTAFMLSAKKGHVECLKLLLDTQLIDINHANNDGNTAFSLSAEKGHARCFKLLLDTELIDINHCNNDGDTALILSAEGNHFDCVKLLLDTRGVDINHCNNDGQNVLFFLSTKGHEKCLQCLLDTGKVDFDPSKYGNAINYALSSKSPECLMLLLEHIPETQRADDHMKAIFLKHSAKAKDLFFISHFLNTGCFQWSWYAVFPLHRQRTLGHELVIRGYAPRQFEWNCKISSPLHQAFLSSDNGLARYLVANLYLTQFDVEHFQRDTNLKSHVSLNGSESIKELHRQIFTSPWRLEAMSLLRISTLLRDERRENDIAKLDGLLPGCFLRLLGIKNPIRRLCKCKWEQIDATNLFLLFGRRSIEMEETNSAECCDLF